MSVTDRYIIREMNEKLVLRTIIQRDTISRAEISKETQLNKATVSSIVAGLLQRGLIVELGEGSSSGGRKPILVCFNHRAAIALAVDLQPDRFSYLFTFLNGEVLLENTLPKPSLNSHIIFTTLVGEIGKHLPNLPLTKYGLIGMTLAIHGIIDHEEMIFSPFYDFDTLALRETLQQYFNIPVYLENEANLAALGETQFSTPSSNLIAINIKYGIGAGIILDNELYRGANGFAGEVGHMITVPGGRPCPCGNHGCMEQYASEFHTLKHYLPAKEPGPAGIRQLLQDYQVQKPNAVKAIDDFTANLALGVNNLLTAFNPSVIVINSRLLDQPEIMKLLKSKLNYRINGRTMIKNSTLKDRATLLGGIQVAHINFLGI